MSMLSTGEVLSHKKYGEHYHSLTVVTPDIGEAVKPGQFVNIRCGENRASILRRPFSVCRVHKRGGWSSTLEIVFDIRGPGSEHLSTLRAHANVDLLGPLGRGFAMPNRRAHCLLVGGGIGAGPPCSSLLMSCATMAIAWTSSWGAGGWSFAQPDRSASSGFGVSDHDRRRQRWRQRRCHRCSPRHDQRCGTEVVYACGPHPMLAAVSNICATNKVPVQVAVEELMGCGYGVCMTCVIPLRRRLKKGEAPEEAVVYARSCTEGPVFNGATVIWNGAGGVPAPPLASELSPSGTVGGRGATEEIPSEHAPPGN